jgi:hypothetical protein
MINPMYGERITSDHTIFILILHMCCEYYNQNSILKREITNLWHFAFMKHTFLITSIYIAKHQARNDLHGQNDSK